MRNLAKRERCVNRILLPHLPAGAADGEDARVADFDLRDLFKQYILELYKMSEMSQADFARSAGIPAPNLSSMMPDAKKKRTGSWKQIEKMINKGVVTPLEVFERLFQLASHRQHPSMPLPVPRLQREKLRERLVSGEIHGRAAANVQAPPTGGQPLHPKLTERLQHRKTGGKG